MIRYFYHKIEIIRAFIFSTTEGVVYYLEGRL